MAAGTSRPEGRARLAALENIARWLEFRLGILLAVADKRRRAGEQVDEEIPLTHEIRILEGDLHRVKDEIDRLGG